MHICPRCESYSDVIAKSPKYGVWEMYQCAICFFTWRSNEPEYITNPKKYNKAFKVNPADVPNAIVVPAVPERR
ncbi:non-oxidative hydroxyarylic acid decarboxylases subunit D [Bacillus sp. Marseille-P3661]|uniref:non-oxidative hydroxyarylic acid decarboxylases subunit D n=1 Tax=Bacillus sp. Marseille-P3661 TaxID=1936234 RepID=UPI000C843D61|nr:non-oxidative hydroxyarylic acid decarboxylases subunit D [Bacillus sp. Marseille-P3661]